MSVEDMRVSRDVRRVLAKRWIKLQRLNYNVVNGTLYMRGHLEVMREPATSRTEKETDQFGIGPKFMLSLERELMKVPGVRTLRWDLSSWNRGSSGWSHRGL